MRFRISGFGFRIAVFRPAPSVPSLRAATCVLMLAALTDAGCAGGQRQTRRDVYLHLMTPLQQAEYLHMEAIDKPLSLRLAYLQEIGVYQEWSEQPKKIQDAILARRVVEGMTTLQVQMAWGLPEERRDEASPAERAEGHSKAVWDYGSLTLRGGGSGHERRVCFFDGAVLWVRQAR